MAVNGQSQDPYAVEDLHIYLQQGQIAPSILALRTRLQSVDAPAQRVGPGRTDGVGGGSPAAATPDGPQRESDRFCHRRPRDAVRGYRVGPRRIGSG
ncbi:hypothetical protein DFAR_2140002 [Desulfarculales bacterium]